MAGISNYYNVMKELRTRLDEPAPGRLQILTGPRQVGKTTILLDLMSRRKSSAIYLAVDAPEAMLPGWWELQWRRALQKAGGGKTILLLDEIQYLPQWSRLVKAAMDEIFRKRLPLHVVVTGSSAIEIGAGARETMAGRYERLRLCHWNPADLAAAFSLSPEQAVSRYIRHGAFPGSFHFLAEPLRWKAYMRDSIIEPATGRDLMMLKTIRRPALLRQVFAVCTGHPSEIMSLGKIAARISDPGTLETVAHYLELLEEAYLVASLRKHSGAMVRRRSSPPKLLPLSNALMAAAREGDPPLPETDPAAWGRWLENACLAFAVNNGQSLSYWREEPLEVDAICSGSWGKWAVEIKTSPFTTRDVSGLMEFCRRYPEYAPLVICDKRHSDAAARMGLEHRNWQEFLWQGIA